MSPEVIKELRAIKAAAVREIQELEVELRKIPDHDDGSQEAYEANRLRMSILGKQTSRQKVVAAIELLAPEIALPTYGLALNGKTYW